MTFSMKFIWSKNDSVGNIESPTTEFHLFAVEIPMYALEISRSNVNNYSHNNVVLKVSNSWKSHKKKFPKLKTWKKKSWKQKRWYIAEKEKKSWKQKRWHIAEKKRNSILLSVWIPSMKSERKSAFQFWHRFNVIAPIVAVVILLFFCFFFSFFHISSNPGNVIRSLIVIF